MKKIFRVTLGSLLLIFLVVGFSGELFAQEKMKFDDWKIEIEKWQKREQDAKAAIAIEQAGIDELNKKIAAADAQINQVKAETLTAIGTDAAGMEAFKGQIDAIQSQLNTLLALSQEELFKKKADLDAIEKQIAALERDPRSATTDNQNRIAELKSLLARARQKAQPVQAAVSSDIYNVLRGDYLWRIAGKKDVYSDPFKWNIIYYYNRDQIKNPDLIFPNQRFKIQQAASAGEYWTIKGDWLSKIAGYSNIYGDPFKWTKLYEANKDQISDPSLIYQNQVLTIPAK
jgi:nucleoid-associated protein YgaU